MKNGLKNTAQLYSYYAYVRILFYLYFVLLLRWNSFRLEWKWNHFRTFQENVTAGCDPCFKVVGFEVSYFVLAPPIRGVWRSFRLILTRFPLIFIYILIPVCRNNKPPWMDRGPKCPRILREDCFCYSRVFKNGRNDQDAETVKTESGVFSLKKKLKSCQVY